MQNRIPNIDERLQILNDYIQRTIDALNVTRQVAQGLVNPGYQPNVTMGGLGHTTWTGNVGPQFVQTPWGIVAVNQTIPQTVGIPQNIGFAQNVGIPNVGIGNVGIPQTLGLGHTTFVPQFPMNVGQLPVNVGQWQGYVPQYAQTMGVPQLTPVQNVTGNIGLSHTGFVPNFVPMQFVQTPMGLVPYGYGTTVGTIGLNNPQVQVTQTPVTTPVQGTI